MKSKIFLIVFLLLIFFGNFIAQDLTVTENKAHSVYNVYSFGDTIATTSNDSVQVNPYKYGYVDKYPTLYITSTSTEDTTLVYVYREERGLSATWFNKTLVDSLFVTSGAAINKVISDTLSNNAFEYRYILDGQTANDGTITYTGNIVFKKIQLVQIE
jgi:hypothetical protein